jgi:hypothetical protein
MRAIVRVLAAISLLAVFSACGSAGDDHADSTTPASSATGESADSAGPDVVSVTLHRSGGLKPMTVTRVFTADEPPPDGYDPVDVRRVMAAADAFVAADADVNPLPSNTCCDRYTYAVTLQYADGTSRTFETVDGVAQPRLFARLLQALS